MRPIPIYSQALLKKIFIACLVLILLGLHLTSLRQIRDKGGLPLNDFIEYWSAARVFAAGGNPYRTEDIFSIQRDIGWKDTQPLMMWNPPWTLPLLLPFSCLPFWTGRALWYLLNLIIIFVTADWFWLRHGGIKSYRWMSWLAALFFIPVGTALYLGQISPLMLAGLSGFLWALDKKRLGTAGMLLALIAVKPHVLYLFWVFLLFWIIQERAWRTILGYVAAISLLSLPVFLINPSVFIAFYHSLQSPSGPMIWQTPTWGVALHILFPRIGNWLHFLPPLIGLGLSFVLWFKWRLNFKWDRFLPTIVLLSVTSSIFTWTFDWVVLLPIVTLILVWFQAHPSRRWWLLVGLASIYLLALFQPSDLNSYFYTIWLPPALWMLYRAGSKSLHRS